MKVNKSIKMSALTASLLFALSANANPLISVPIDIKTVKTNIGDYGDNNAGQGATLSNGISTSNANSKVGDTSATAQGGNSTATGGTGVGTVAVNSSGTGVGQVGVDASSANANNLENKNSTDVNSANSNKNSQDVKSSNKNDVNSSNSNKNGAASDSTSKSGANSDASNTSKNSTVVEGDITNNSTNVKTLYIPSHVVAVPPSLVAGANVTTQVGVCGTRLKVEDSDIIGTFIGLIKDSTVNLDKRQRFVPTDEVFVEKKYGNLTFLIGHQPIIYSAVISTSGARQIGLGTNSGTGSGGSGSAGASSGMQQMVQQIQLLDCIYSQVDTSK